MAKPREREVEEDRDDVEIDPKEVKEDTLLIDPEDDDGFEGPDNAAAKRQQARVQEDDEEGDPRLAHDEDDDVGGPQERDSRRKRRNRARREAQQQSQAVIQAMSQEVAQLRGQLDQVMRGQVGITAENINGQIAMLQGELDKIDGAMARAVKEADDVTYAKGLRLQREATSRLEALDYERRRLEASVDPRRQQPKAAAPAIDPQAVAEARRLSEDFLDDYSWFDPQGLDKRNRLMAKLDESVMRAGYTPDSEAYWNELRRRAKSNGLRPDTDEGEDDVEDTADTRPARRDSGGLPPRSGRGTGGGGAGKSVTLPAFARETLEEMGLLETKGLSKEQLATRSKYVTQWSKGLKEAASTGGRR